MSNNTDDTMRRIEEALDRYSEEVFNHASDETLAVYETALLATIRAALQPDAGGWGEDDDRHRANDEAAKPHQFVGGLHRSYQELLDAEHERAVEAWVEAVDSCEIRALQTVSGFQVYFLPEHVLDEALRLMRRQPKETTDG